VPVPTAGDAATTAGPTAPRSGPLHHNGLVLDPDRHEVAVDGRPVALTHVEFRILQTLLDADGRVLSRDQLLDAVWGADQNEVLDRTVDVHIRRLRDKLGDDPDAPRWIATVRGSGYRSAPTGG
jgi:DNA-binding response OmpR family regulator